MYVCRPQRWRYIESVDWEYATQMGTLQLSLEFSGGAELLFGNVKQHTVAIPTGEDGLRVEDLLVWIKVSSYLAIHLHKTLEFTAVFFDTVDSNNVGRTSR